MLNTRQLQQLMVNAIRTNMKKIDPNAKPTDFQVILSKAISSGVIKTLQTSTVVSNVVSGPAIDVGRGIILNRSFTVNRILQLCRQYFGGKTGKALKLLIESIVFSIANHIQSFAEIQSTSGFGGPPIIPIQGINGNSLLQLILMNLPAKDRSNIMKSKYGYKFFKAIANGLAQGLTQAQANVVPSAPPSQSSGLLVGIIK